MISFFVMRRMQGRPQPVRVVLGRYPDVSLAQARKLATAALGDLVSGVHPRPARGTGGCSQAGSEHLCRAGRAFLPGPPPPSSAPLLRLEKRSTGISCRAGAARGLEITRADAITMVETLDQASGPYMAAKALALASSIFRFGVTREQVASNPCDLIKPSDFVGDMAPRQRVLTAAELALLWQATKANPQDGIESTYPAGPFARFLLLTAVRRSEAARMTWGEVDLDDALWVIPARRTKSGIPHEVPLSAIAIDLLQSLPRFAGDFVFSTTGGRARSGFDRFKNTIDARVTGCPPG